MRETKFRVWVTFNNNGNTNIGRMFPVRLLGFNSGLINMLQVDDEDTSFVVHKGMHGDYYLMQFTGLKDKNGKEIWEGDIVEITAFKDTDPKYRREVIFKEGMFGFPFEEAIGLHCQYKLTGFNSIEVLGNIYQNKELLDGAE